MSTEVKAGPSARQILKDFKKTRHNLAERFRVTSMALGAALREATPDAIEDAAVEEELIQEVEEIVEQLDQLIREIGAPSHLTPVEMVRRLRARE